MAQINNEEIGNLAKPRRVSLYGIISVVALFVKAISIHCKARLEYDAIETYRISTRLFRGPLGIVIIHEALSKGLSAGIRASFAPLITDVPIILISFYILNGFKEINYFIAIISLLGGLNLLWMSMKMFRNNKNYLVTKYKAGNNNSLWTAVRINFLSPNPYLFWFTAGGAYLVSGTLNQSIAFIFFSLFFLIAAKILVAYIAVHFSQFLSSDGYLSLMKFLALLMAVFGFILLYKSYATVSSVI